MIEKDSTSTVDEILLQSPKFAGTKRFASEQESPVKERQEILPENNSPMQEESAEKKKKDKRNIKGLSIAIPKHNKFLEQKMVKNVFFKNLS
jgi:hypothetical protein